MSDRKTWIEDPSLTYNTAGRLERDHAQRNSYNRTWLSLGYESFNDSGMDWARPARELGLLTRARRGMGFNLLRELADASAAQVCRNLQAQLLPVGADSETHRSVKTLNRLIDGIFDVVNFCDVATRAYRNAQYTDIGALGFAVDGSGEILCERKDPMRVYWPIDGTDYPSALFYVDGIPRRQLLARYSGKRTLIENAEEYRPDYIAGVHLYGTAVRDSDCVKVVTATGLGTADKPGRSVVCISNAVLESGAWEFDFHPIVMTRWDYDDYNGVSGFPLARVLAPYHVAVNRCRRRIERCLAGAVPTAMIPLSMANHVSFSDQEFQRIVYPDGAQKPEIVQPQMIPPEILQEVERLYARAAAEAGISKSLAAGEGPTSGTSGRYLREYVSIANQRAIVQQRVWEKLWKDSARVVVALANKVYQNKSVRVSAPQTDWLDEIKWLSPKDLKEDQYKVRFKLSSGRGSQFAEKLEALDEFRQTGMGDIEDVATKLFQPDIEALMDRVTGPREYVDKMLDDAVYGDGPLPVPSVWQGDQLHQVVKLGKQKWQQHMTMNTPPEKMERLRRVIMAAESIIKGPPVAPALTPDAEVTPPAGVAGPGGPPPLPPPGAPPMGAPPPAPLPPV